LKYDVKTAVREKWSQPTVYLRNAQAWRFLNQDNYVRDGEHCKDEAHDRDQDLSEQAKDAIGTKRKLHLHENIRSRAFLS